MTFLSRRSRTTPEVTAPAAPSQQQPTFSTLPTTDPARQAACSYWVRRRRQTESRSS